jgi:hypothetical protein
MSLLGFLVAFLAYWLAAFVVSCAVGRFIAVGSARSPEVRR